LSACFPGLQVELVESGGGAFEVSVDEEAVFSKLSAGRFPAYQEIPELLGP
jgi:selT/selW/selH-like putative selenoprotein